ncbi:hypothetical protein FAZ78_08950 [Cereibacter changlensis]|uniref:Uncharacterized protein n=1 Tax=Cereibacter changlensis TaxID=402884 RepID=A0A4U0Z0S8_9RHOB|nr:hypothetical protein [Cereibacter changlensis]TKA96889.1 hypothetical protein FAZ78_08950 [Cereibacter changlensis]
MSELPHSSLPGVAADICEAIGMELTVRLLRRRGGCELNIPRRAPGSLLAEIIGEEAAQVLIATLGHGRIVLPCASMRGAKARRSEAKAMLMAGHSLQQVALACDLHTRTVSKYRAELEREDEAVHGSRQYQLPL